MRERMVENGGEWGRIMNRGNDEEKKRKTTFSG